MGVKFFWRLAHNPQARGMSVVKAVATETTIPRLITVSDQRVVADHSCWETGGLGKLLKVTDEGLQGSGWFLNVGCAVGQAHKAQQRKLG
jgi:hypothetical protein